MDIITGKLVTDAHVIKALGIDGIVYGSEYHLSADQCLGYFHANPYIYIMAISGDSVIGCVNFSPVTQDTYTRMLSGQELDTFISPEDIVEYVPYHSCYAYFSSVAVLPRYRGQGIASAMLASLRNLMNMLSVQGIAFDGIVADAISPAGEKIAASFGLLPVRPSVHGIIMASSAD